MAYICTSQMRWCVPGVLVLGSQIVGSMELAYLVSSRQVRIEPSEAEAVRANSGLRYTIRGFQIAEEKP